MALVDIGGGSGVKFFALFFSSFKTDGARREELKIFKQPLIFGIFRSENRTRTLVQ